MTGLLRLTEIVIDTPQRRVVDTVSLEVPGGEIVALLGPNGAGKSELVLGVAGMLPMSGSISIDGKPLATHEPEAVRAAGIAAVPEGHHTLGGLSVLDNLRASGANLNSRDLEMEVENAFDVFPELRRLSGQKSGSLSGGQQQMVALAQALVCRPKFLLIDEMSLGLAPVVIERLVGVVQSLKKKGIGILLIEQFTQLALDVADTCYVIAQGRICFSGKPDTLRSDPSILERAYLG